MLNAHPDYLNNRWRPIVVCETMRHCETDTTRIAYTTPDGQKHITPGFCSLAEADKWFAAIIALEQ